MKYHTVVHHDLLTAQESVYTSMKLVCSKLTPEAESKEYGACTFEMNGKIIKFRVAKITPKKIGQFVTFWKRIGDGPIMPYDTSDQFDFLIVSVRAGKNFGQFIFPKNVLWQKEVISKDGKGGKRAMRVYPPWDLTDNQQAKKTQAWQLLYFVAIEPSVEIDHARKLLL